MTVYPDNILRCMQKEERQRLGKSGLTAAEAAAKAEVRNEKELHDLIWNELLRQEFVVGHAKMTAKSRYTVGWPDFSLSVYGRPCAIEVKLPGKRLDPDQVRVIGQMRRPPNRWIVGVVRSFLEFKQFLDAVMASSPAAEINERFKE